MVLDLVSPAQSEAGAVSRTAATNSSSAATITELDVAAPSDAHAEWSMTKLPPLPPQSRAAPAAEAPAKGEAITGQASGVGVDPYAFASYQSGLFERLATGATVQPNPDALAALERSIRQRLIERGIAIKLQLLVAKDGRVASADITSPLAASSRAIIQNAVQGTVLFRADPARPDQVKTTLTLNV